MAHSRGRLGPTGGGEFDDDDDDDSLSSSNGHGDRIRRNYIYNQATNHQSQLQQQQYGQQPQPVFANLNGQQPETIQVHLNESYFAKERKYMVNVVANARQKLSSIQMFNPAKNQSMKEQQERNWSENEKYTLDSLNEIKGALDEQFQWSRPEDGRQVWSSKLQYFLAITSYSIGLGNVIRFPILVQKNGGLAFIILFVIMLIVEGIPLFYLELAIGQRMRKAAISCWNLVSPFAAGIGIASAAVSFLVGLYYNTMVAWTLLYLWNSATKRPLPFTQCPSPVLNATRQGKGAAVVNNSAAVADCQTTGPYEYYWFKETLNASGNVDTWAPLNLSVVCALVLAWLISYLCLARGLSSSKRVVYVASTFPYIILTVFFFKAISLEGMSDGVYYLLAPEWSKLADPYVWLQSASQVFFSLGLGFGGLIALSSYNKVNNNCYRDAIKVSLINFLTSIYAGVVIFAILGYKAHLSYDKCLVEQQRLVDVYIADWNLKVIDYGRVFKANHSENAANFLASIKDQETNSSMSGSEDIDSDLSDAVDSIRSLDKTLDLNSPNGSFDYGDRDVEFVLDASSLISPSDLEEAIANIPNLPKCSVEKELDDASQGTGLVFVVMAEAISQFQDAPVWALIFFLMLLTLGLDSQFGNLEGLLSSLMDLKFANSIKRQWITGFICILSLILSIILFAHSGGSYMFAIFDEYAGSFSLVLIALFELIAIAYLYGLKRFCDDCELMTGKRPPFLILLSWRYISPILLLVIIFSTIREFTKSLTYQAWMGDHLESKTWPLWCIVLCAIIIFVCVIWIPAIAILRASGVSLIEGESLSQCWFPAEELREFHDLQEEHKVTRLERILFGFRSDDD